MVDLYGTETAYAVLLDSADILRKPDRKPSRPSYRRYGWYPDGWYPWPDYRPWQGNCHDDQCHYRSSPWPDPASAACRTAGKPAGASDWICHPEYPADSRTGCDDRASWNSSGSSSRRPSRTSAWSSDRRTARRSGSYESNRSTERDPQCPSSCYPGPHSRKTSGCNGWSSDPHATRHETWRRSRHTDRTSE